MKIGIVGYGNMGSAIAERIKQKYSVFVFDKDVSKFHNVTGIEIAEDVSVLIKKSDALIFAVKPQDFDGVLSEMTNNCSGKIVISIAAAITTAYIEKRLDGARVVRVMPNIGAKIGKSVTCLCRGQSATIEDAHFAKMLFDLLGKTWELSEDMMNAATAISGSGPGYYFDAVESRQQDYFKDGDKFKKDFVHGLTLAAQENGFDHRTAKFLAHWTVVFSDLLLKQTKLPAGELRNRVTSKGGTTEAALKILHSGGSLADAVKAAVQRARELAKS